MTTSRKRKFHIAAVLGALVSLAAIPIAALGCAAMGASAKGARLDRMRLSPQWDQGRFKNKLPGAKFPIMAMMREWMFGGSDFASPESPPPFVARSKADFAKTPADNLRITWFGHSSVLVEIDGMRVLTDPVWSERSSPVSFMGPKRFHPVPIPLEELPDLDVVVISHDHYDHLDYETIVKLAETTDVKFVVPLGVGAHLEYWDVAPERITELDWWESHTLGNLKLTATPARHFSGRGMTDRDDTLWAGWAIAGPEHRVFFSGDTAMFPGFAAIGDQLGPFDVTLIESGAYNAFWRDVHIGPEQAVRAHEMLRGKVMMPVHWGTFDLALHGWTEPVERIVAAADAAGVRVATPRAGESFEPSGELPTARWWPKVPWQTVAEAPVVSSGLQGSVVYGESPSNSSAAPAGAIPAAAAAAAAAAPAIAAP